MTRFLAYRGPEGQESWRDISIALGHTLLRTARYADARGQQLTQLDKLTITADVRLDSPGELKERLERAGRQINESVTDVLLILHSYATWGSKCVEYLKGDFGFGIWDAKAKTLFCARDHLGIKPFYYVAFAKLFLFSNTLNCLRQHPAVSTKLNDKAIGDFLLFGLNYDNTSTTFHDIQRLPPAHTLLVSRQTLEMKCYWTLPTDERVECCGSGEYVRQFDLIFKAGVADRMRSDRVGIFLSGGLDSGAVASAAKELAMHQGGIPDIRTYTVGYDRLISDDEGAKARMSADYLGLPNQYVALDDKKFIIDTDDSQYTFPEPVEYPVTAGWFEQFRIIASDCRLALYGEGADNLMYFQMWPHLQELSRNGYWRRLLKDTGLYLWLRPVPWKGIAARLETFFRMSSEYNEVPNWISPDFVRRQSLDSRLRECVKLAMPSKKHAVRPKAHASMSLPQWTSLFELQNPGVTRSPLHVVYPFLDLRTVSYLLAIPPFPLLYKKALLRRALIGKIPEVLRMRPKTPLSANPETRMLQELRNREMRGNELKLTGRINEFVATTALEKFCGNMSSAYVRSYCLARWLNKVL
jgi:asparagine synthase (glutamine-hydrolysing)